MIDACSISRSGGEETYDDTTGEYTTPASVLIYAGPCEIQVTDSLNAQDADAGGEIATVLRLTLKVPVSVTGVRIDDVATVTDSVLDPDLVDRSFRIVAPHAKSFSTARRFQVEEVTP